MEVRAHEQAAGRSPRPGSRLQLGDERTARLHEIAALDAREPPAHANAVVIRISCASTMRPPQPTINPRAHLRTHPAPPRRVRARLRAGEILACLAPSHLEFPQAAARRKAGTVYSSLPVPTQIDSGRHRSLESEDAHDFLTSFVFRLEVPAAAFVSSSKDRRPTPVLDQAGSASRSMPVVLKCTMKAGLSTSSPRYTLR
ncbi:hypothetical protein C8R45DRAFT_316474 [Mycena sanguinolenta]|nr:hypothetical protein C8R45DRAFT_316474 [Mycena sanguinolenta]